MSSGEARGASHAWTASAGDLAEAARRMRAFAERTGLSPAREHPHRYLWTDAFAVCNFLGLAAATGDAGFAVLARELVDQVHATLGWYRADDRRRGPISGLSLGEARAHPTAGGLRIGKPLPERSPEEPFVPGLEWERDGQYLHYLTKWMQALDAMGRHTGEARYHRWARELARVAHEAFTRAAPRGQMVWKMSTALDRPLVSSMGQHDALDALITYQQLSRSPAGGGPDLTGETEDAARMCRGGRFATDDALGIGGLLIDASRLAQLTPIGDALVEPVLVGAAVGLDVWRRARQLERAASDRLAFRELGLAIGLRAYDGTRAALARAAGEGLAAIFASLDEHRSLANRIGAFWRSPSYRLSLATHRDIDEVMLATYLAPRGFLQIA